MAERKDKGQAGTDKKSNLLDSILKRVYKVKQEPKKPVGEEDYVRASLIDRDEVRRVLQKATPEVKLPESEEKKNIFELVQSQEYKHFKTEEEELRLIKTGFEKACRFTGKYAQIKPDPKTQKKLEDAIEFLWLNVTPPQILGLALFVMFGMFLIGAFLMVSGLVCAPLAFVLILMGFGAFFMVPKYPIQLAEQKQMRAIGEMPIVLLYLIMYLRNNPVLEGAIQFAAVHLEGPIAMDFRKLLWDVQNRKYLSMSDAMYKYSYLWSKRSKEFSEALRLLFASSLEKEELRRNSMLNQAIDVMMGGTTELMRHYTASLKMPMNVLHALGIMLPVMGLVMFPMVVMFMSDVITTGSLAFAYDVLLAIVVYGYSVQIMASRPATGGAVDVPTGARGLPKPGCYLLTMGDREIHIPMLPVALAVSLPFLLYGITYLMNPRPPEDFTMDLMYRTLSILWGLTAFVYIYFKYTTIQKLKIRKSMTKLESEFGASLFELGNRLMSGLPIEVALGKASETIKGTEVSNLFTQINQNMTNLGLTFEKALFDPEFGAMKNYPSGLVRSIMLVLVESSKKGVKSVAHSMLAISRYLKSMHNIEEEIMSGLGETAGTMRFQGLFLAPVICGVVVGLGVMIMQILIGLRTKVSTFGAGAAAGAEVGMDVLGGGFLGVPSTSPEIFQLVIGIYMFEVCLILTNLSGQIYYGKDQISIRNSIAGAIIMATILYSAAVLGSGGIFSGLTGTITS